MLFGLKKNKFNKNSYFDNFFSEKKTKIRRECKINKNNNREIISKIKNKKKKSIICTKINKKKTKKPKNTKKSLV